MRFEGNQIAYPISPQFHTLYPTDPISFTISSSNLPLPQTSSELIDTRFQMAAVGAER